MKYLKVRGDYMNTLVYMYANNKLGYITEM